MKNSSFLLALFFVLFSLSLKADVLTPDSEKEINLKGRYGSDKPTKSLSVAHPFTAILIDNSILSIYANSPITDVTISIYKDSVVVDQYVFSFDAIDTEIISLTGYESGDYVLVLTTPLGIYLHGTFSL